MVDVLLEVVYASFVLLNNVAPTEVGLHFRSGGFESGVRGPNRCTKIRPSSPVCIVKIQYPRMGGNENTPIPDRKLTLPTDRPTVLV